MNFIYSNFSISHQQAATNEKYFLVEREIYMLLKGLEIILSIPTVKFPNCSEPTVLSFGALRFIQLQQVWKCTPE